MKREMRRTGAPPPEAGAPSVRFHVPRHLWPAAWEALSEARAVFVTGLAQPSALQDPAAKDELEAAFQREAGRVRALQARGNA